MCLLTSGPALEKVVYTVMYEAYIAIGGYYAERRMLRIFGEDYRRYQRQVGAYVPRLGRRRGA